MQNRLAGKVAVVTGAASGIGEAILRCFHGQGARVVAADISGGQNALAAELGEGCLPFQVDVREADQVEAMMAAAMETFGAVNILCNNAGIEGRLVPTADTDQAEFDNLLAVNCRGVFLGMRYALPLMIAGGGGSIINIASAAGMIAFPGMVGYCASKGAVRMMTKTAAAEYGRHGIRVNAICPGVIATPLIAHIDENIVAAAKAHTPAGRLGEVEEVANLALYLASDESRFVTGADMLIDGGMTAL
ncbi:SDR family oxidoreductase [Spongiibacter taiwanensis]|uniref:SDR family NAD(P)-dependent oxidoreductase n=1 Tax=Spongiibacter taiwanensis TaxID=1748242 RepID=UPI002034F1B4|nr:SDR family oxidoreductase [Spongiibacter taiwanensis]USA42668.1 SDR family oxidoreductase [Spongiibacter taiwanensis]